jgi:type II secretory pathway pseudopilin PulG
MPITAASRAGAAFTLLELLVVMGILVLLATLTAIGVGKVTRDAKLANATNVLVAALGNARAVAIRDNTYVLVTFRIAPDRRSRAVPREPQVVQVITARWTGEVVTPGTPTPPGVEMPATDDVFGDRFLQAPGVPVLELPVGVYVAGPGFFRGIQNPYSYGASDAFWYTLPTFAGTANYSTVPPSYAFDRAATEVGNAIGVMFAPDGRTVSRLGESVTEIDTGANTDQNAWEKPFLDVDGNGFPNRGTSQFGSFPALQNVSFFYYDEPLDEPFVDLVPYLAVFNLAEARDRRPYLDDPVPSNDWRGPNIGGLGSTTATFAANEAAQTPRVRDISRFVSEQSERITFNRFSGVPQIVPK